MLFNRQSGAMVAERILKMSTGFLITIVLARYLSLEEFGILSIVQTMVVVLAALATVGIDASAVQWFTQKKMDVFALSNSLIVIRLMAAAAIHLGVLLLWLFTGAKEFSYLSIISFALYFYAFNVVHKLYEYRQIGYVTATLNSIGVLLAFALKVAVILLGGSLAQIVMVMVFESAIIAFICYFSYLKMAAGKKFSWLGIKLVYPLIRQSWPLVFSLLAASLYGIIDLFVLRLYESAEVVGVYSAALRLSEAWFSLLSVYFVSVTPSIIAALQKDPLDQRTFFVSIYRKTTLCCVVVSVVVLFAAPQFIALTFGESFSAASVILSIHIWGGWFIGWRQISGKVMIAKSQIGQHVKRFGWGLVVNLIFCVLLVPFFGMIGAALSSVIAHLFVGFLADFFDVETRDQFFLKLQALRA